MSKRLALRSRFARIAAASSPVSIALNGILSLDQVTIAAGEALLDRRSFLVVFCDQARWPDQAVSGRQPKEIQEQQIPFPRVDPGSASNHLAQKRTRFRRAEDHDAINRGLVVALR
jgi:hypothetical protein